ncbi:MAG: phosphatase PAP2 family protein [Candidatus Aminicenantes bacterium]|nr:phosphatase PAP2 family protein [Candidatus Aminicenantes bacterium]
MGQEISHINSKNKPACRFHLFSLLLLAFLILAVNPVLRAEKSDIPDRLNRQFFKHLAGKASQVLTSPGQWRLDDRLSAAVASVAVLAFLPADESIHLWVSGEPGAAGATGARIFSGLGGPAVLLGLVSSGYLFGCLNHSPETRKTFLLAAESLLLTEILVQVGKTGLGRARPYTGEGAFSFHPLNFREKWNSFPSGHSAAAWALAATISERVDNPYLEALLYTFATGVSLSRILLDKHFASDVLAGSVIGYFVGKKTTQPLRTQTTGWSVGLLATGSVIGLSLNYTY